MPLRRFMKSSHGSDSVEETMERFGLFTLVDTTSGTGSTSARRVDIVAVHGLGGHWLRTWAAMPSGAVWIRDRLPLTLEQAHAQPRVLSFGYDADHVFSTTVSDIDDCAKSLLDRLRMARATDEARKVPIVFIAHSMGGLVFQQAMNLAHTNEEYYKDVLKRTRGCVFLASPLHGTDAAKWGEMGIRVAHALSGGLLGNRSHLKAMKRNSDVWLRISRDFVQRGARLTFRSFYETKKLGNKIIVDKASARLGWANEIVSGLENSDHRSICRFGPEEEQRYGPVGQAVLEIVEEALKKRATTGTKLLSSMSSIYVSTSSFFRGSFESLVPPNADRIESRNVFPPDDSHYEEESARQRRRRDSKN